MTKAIQLSVARDFSRFPAGRYRTDGEFSGQRFREDYLVAALREGDTVEISLDGTIGYGSSFLEEAFGGLVRVHGFQPKALLGQLKLHSADPSLAREIRNYIQNTKPEKVRA